MAKTRQLQTSQAEYDQAKAKVREVLWKWVAGLEPGQYRDPVRKDDPVTYGGLAKILGMHHIAGNFRKVLNDVDRDMASLESPGPMITVLVVNQKYHVSGKGFFTMARKLGHVLKNERQERAFMIAERRAALRWIRQHPDGA